MAKSNNDDDKSKTKKDEPVQSSDVYRIPNNVQYRFVSNNKVFAEMFNIAMGFEFVDPSNLHDCDSREVAFLAEEVDPEESKEEKDFRETLVLLSKELFRDIKKLGVMKSDGRYIYLCIENQMERKNILEKIHLYNAISLYNSKKCGGRRIPIITCLSGWNPKQFGGEAFIFDDYDVEPGSVVLEYLPRYKVPMLVIGALDEEILKNASAEIKVADYAVKLATDKKMDKEEKMEYLKKIDGLFANICDEAKDLTLAVTGLSFRKEEVVENGFSVLWEEIREDSFEEGIEKGRFTTLFQLVNDGDLSIEKAALKANMTVEEFLKTKEEYEK